MIAAVISSTGLNSRKNANGATIANEGVHHNLFVVSKVTKASDGEVLYTANDKGKLTWTDDRGTVDKEPQASFGRKFQSWMTRVLPLEKQL